MPPEKYDFSGWATKNNLRCSDGRIIRRGAFLVNDGQMVPLVWNHQHNSPEHVLGHAILENREDGVYAYCEFNDSVNGQNAKQAVKHGDVKALSIWANGLNQNGSEVLHGNIREVSLVLAGANPGAFIESVLSHMEPIDEFDEEGIFYTNEEIVLFHSEETSKKEMKKEAEKEKKDKTVEDVYDTLNDEQKKAVAVIVGMAIRDSKRDSDDGEEKKEENEMKHNIFSDKNEDQAVGAFLSHDDMKLIFDDGKKMGSLRESVRYHIQEGVLAHSIDTTGMTGPSSSTSTQSYGFRDPDMLFPEFRSTQAQPEWISRNMGWVDKVLSRVHRTPFSRVKSVFADITEDDARARGYLKGKLKKEEVFTLLKRTTAPTTIYKKQKIDRDDMIDITDFDVVAWIRAEMRLMLNEEIARAILIGDGRSTASDDHINESNIRPIIKEAPLFNTVVKVTVESTADEAAIAKATINAIIRSRKKYKGSGSPDFYTTEDVVTEMLLLEDQIGHKLYKTETEVSTAIRAKEIVTVEPMEDTTLSITESSTTKSYPVIGVLVNLNDYNVGADKGGEINIFDDFDIDYNQQKYLIETRISGALTKPFSAITLVLDKKAATTPSNPSNP